MTSFPGNGNQYPDGAAVEVRFPLPETLPASPRSEWPWLPGTIEQQVGPDEWDVVVEDHTVAELEDGSPAPAGTPENKLYFPRCFRDASEIRWPDETELQAGS